MFHIEIISGKFCFTQFCKSCQLDDVPHCLYTAYSDFGWLPWPLLVYQRVYWQFLLGCWPIVNFFSDAGLLSISSRMLAYCQFLLGCSSTFYSKKIPCLCQPPEKPTRFEGQHPRRNCQYTRWYTSEGHGKHPKSVYAVYGQRGTSPNWFDFQNCVKQNFQDVISIWNKIKTVLFSISCFFLLFGIRKLCCPTLYFVDNAEYITMNKNNKFHINTRRSFKVIYSACLHKVNIKSG